MRLARRGAGSRDLGFGFGFVVSIVLCLRLYKCACGEYIVVPEEYEARL